MKDRKHIIIVGAGPGGLTAAMLLAHRGFKVTVLEQESVVGGRNKSIVMDGYSFDTGPTFLMMSFILKEMFEAVGERMEDHLELIRLEPMYRLSFNGLVTEPTTDKNRMREQLARLFPGDEKGLDLFHKKEKVRYDKMYPCLQKPYGKISDLFSKPLLRALPYLDLTRTLFDSLGSYFKDERCKISFTFQAKYLGMSPWECPAAFTIIPYIEHEFGIFHVKGGLSRISDAMAVLATKRGCEIRLNTKAEKIRTVKGKAAGVVLEDGKTLDADAVVVNADFGHAANTLFEKGQLRRWSPDKLKRKHFSCSTFMLYLGIDKLYDEPFHHIIFAKDYRANINDITQRKILSEDMSVYVRNASRLDPKLAPKGHSALYVLVPVPNNSSHIAWDGKLTGEFREKVLNRIVSNTGMKDLRQHIVKEQVITPSDWEQKHNVHLGATFNLGHQVSQMLYFRPHNRFEDCKNCYLVGGGTHPGSGLPTIYESARISAALIQEDLG
jgi:phytoene desaturase